MLATLVAAIALAATGTAFAQPAPADYPNRLPEYDTAYEAFLRTPPGPQRNALVRTMSELAQTYAPMTFQVNPITNVFVHKHVHGYHPSPFGFSWKYLDVDPTRRAGS